MEANLILVYLLYLFLFVKCYYPPSGDEVLPGSVLLPATRRGRYLANIVRRQAVDGTGIKFNKDADRMNAEAKKKVDVLSDELLPYIIAEQDRRTTLYRRIMTAIQNGEKGVTIAEIRNKPPLIIRKGVLYRCPANRAPKEPDGSGTLMCEDDIEPAQVMYDSCLSVEDRDLYVADNKYFFCNRHRVEGPDLPRNGSAVIGCPPIERTSLNYTSIKCALEDTDDVVVHYRYYPDRTYKFVSELDPEHEVCDHWNPCQIGYIYSLPTPDQAMPANELFHGYTERFDEYERDEIVPPIPEDALEEFVYSSTPNYVSSPRRIKIPPGYKFEKLWAKRLVDNYGWNPQQNRWHSRAVITQDTKSITVKLFFPDTWSEYFYSAYFAVFTKNGRRSSAKTVKFLIISPSSAHVSPKTFHNIQGSQQNSTQIPYRCPHCLLQGIMIRTEDGHVRNLDPAKFRLIERTDSQGKAKQYIEVFVDDLKPQDFGDFFIIVQNADGMEERIKLITIETAERDTDNAIQLSRIQSSLSPGSHFDRTTQFSCADCALTDVVCNGDSVVAAGRVAVVPISKMITFNFPRYDDSNSCVYIGYFKTKDSDNVYSKIIAVVDNSSPTVTVSSETVPPPHVGEQFEHEIPYKCSEECAIETVLVNGMPLQTSFRRSQGSIGFYVYTPTVLTVRITEYTHVYEGVYQTVFRVGEENVTKTVLEIGAPPVIQEDASTTQCGGNTAGGEVTTAGGGDATTGATTGAIETTTAGGGEGDSTTATATAEEETTTVHSF